MGAGEDLIRRLRAYFGKRHDIAFSFLYGSYSKGSPFALSDVDIAIYFYPEVRRPIEFERPLFYKEEGEIWADLEEIVEKEVELLVLNRAPSTISSTAIKGLPILIRDWGLFLDFMEVVTSEGVDYREFLIKDYIERHEGRD
jgi:predicted nucleotidyltransferase